MKSMVLQTARKSLDLMHVMKWFSISDRQVRFLRKMKFVLLCHLLPTTVMLILLGWGTLLLGNYIVETKSLQHNVIGVDN